MSAVSFMLPVLIVNKFYSAEYTGYFDLSRSLLSIPLALIASSLASVIMQRLSERRNRNQALLKDLIPALAILIIIALIEVIVIEFFGKELFVLVFGEKWGYSGEISRTLVWAYAFNFIVSSFSGVFISLEKIKLLGIWQLIYFSLMVSLFLFRNRTFNDFLSIYVSFEITCYFGYLLLLTWIVYNYELERKEKMVM
jgi:O-antigen/teichoic acid export membrane protein